MTKLDKINPIIHSILIRGLLGTAAFLPLFLNGCSSSQKDLRSFEPIQVEPSEPVPSSASPETPIQTQTQPQTTSQKEEIQKLLISLTEKMEVLDQKINSLNDKLIATRSTLEQLNAKKYPPMTEWALTDPTQSSPVVQATPPGDDPDAGFINDDAVQSYRNSILLFHGQKYPEAVLSFSQFIEHYPDHPLVSSAQYYIGASYARQKEYQLAIQEFGRVLAAYEFSPRITNTLSELYASEEVTKKSSDAALHKELLTSLFPQSPVAVWTLKGSPLPLISEEKPAPEEEVELSPTAPTAPAENPTLDKSSSGSEGTKNSKL